MMRTTREVATGRGYSVRRVEEGGRVWLYVDTGPYPEQWVLVGEFTPNTFHLDNLWAQLGGK